MEKQICELYPTVKPCYVITDQDEIINKNTGNHIKILTARDGYKMVSLMKIGGGTTYLPFHRIKMMAFCPVENMAVLEVNHKDGNKENNDLSNLEWVTSKENIQHAWKTGLSSTKNIQGDKSNLTHYSEELAKQVFELLKTRQYTDKEIARMTNTSAKNFVARIRRRETWKWLTKDYHNELGKAERVLNFNKKSSTTISKESTLQAIGDGKGELLVSPEDEDIV